MRGATLVVLLASAIAVPFVERTRAQSQASVTQPGIIQPNLAQLMKGTLYPESNVVFASQDTNPADVPHARDPAMATDLLASAYGKWEAVENSALAITAVADLLDLPGRKCSNGVEVPVKNADWVMFVQQLRDAGTAAYTAAKAKDQDKMTDVAGVMTAACGNCHRRYREKKLADRCK